MNESHSIASKALKLMFLGQVLSLIGAVLGFIPVVNVIGGLLILVGGIMALVGLIKACPAHGGYKKAVLMIVISIAATVLATVMGTVATLNGSAGTLLVVFLVLPVVNSITSLMQVYYVCDATSTLVRETGNEAVAVKGGTVFRLNAICYALNIIFTVLVAFAAALAAIGSMVAGVVSIIAGIIYMVFLKQASDALAV